METAEFFVQLAAILVSARILAEAGRRFGIPTVISEMSAGIILGPSLLGWLELTEVIQILAELGIILLLFEVGLETDVGRLVRVGTRSVVVAIGGFVIPFVLGFLLCFYVFGLDLIVSLFIGGTLTATSIGVTVRILQDVKRQSSYEGQVVLGAAVLDDILGILLLAFLYDFATSGEIKFANLLNVSIFVGLFFVMAPLLGKAFSYALHHYHRLSESPGLLPSLIVSLVLIFGALAHTVGAPLLLGGFAAGLALSRRFFLPFGLSLATDKEFSKQLESEMRPIVQLFTPIFFVAVGLSLDLKQIDWGSAFIWTFSISVAVAAIAGKIAGGYLLFKHHWLYRAAIGMAMVPRGEVGLVFAQLGLVSGLLNSEVYAGTVIVIVYTTLFSPFWIKIFYRRYGDRIRDELEAPVPGQLNKN